MSTSVLGVAAWTAAGDLNELLERLHTGEHAISDAPPYSSDGLSNPRCGRIHGLDRDRPVLALLRKVVVDALADASIDTLPEGTGLIVATSSGDICGPWAAWHRASLNTSSEALASEPSPRQGPTHALAAELGITGPTTTLSIACASGTAALSIAEGWLHDGVPMVIVAGVDALSDFVHAGFSGLGALSASLPRPFSTERDGLVIGEGAAALVLSKQPGSICLSATGHGTDATHITAPDRGGRGAASALRSALERAALEPADIDMVSVHGTGTRFNDGMEAQALKAIFPPHQLAVHGVKHIIGHTMGAAGVIEAAVCVAALRGQQHLPGPQSITPVAEDGASALAEVHREGAHPPRTALSMSSAFGGVNATALFSREPGPGPTARPTEELTRLTVSLPAGPWSTAELWPDAPDRFRRLDRFTKAGWLALQRLSNVIDLPPDTAIVLASRTNCRGADVRFHQGLVTSGPARASRRAFIYTVPHAPLAEASIALGIRGPTLAFADGPERAGEEAERLVRLGHAPLAVAVTLEAPNDTDAVDVHLVAWHLLSR